jgi:PhnB protein
MAQKVNPIPEGYHTVTPYITVKDVDAEINFLKRAFGATEMYRIPGPDNRPVHAEVRVGDSQVMLGVARDPAKVTRTALYVYVEDCDKIYKSAIATGAKSQEEPKNQFWGDRTGTVEDENGNTWMIATHVEDVAPEDILKRMAAA